MTVTYIEQKEGTKYYILCDSIYMNFKIDYMFRLSEEMIKGKQEC